MGTTSDSIIMVNTEVKEKKTECGDPCPVHGTSRHSWDEYRLKNSMSCPYCQDSIKKQMLNKHMSICKGKHCYECGHLRHMRVECGVRSSGKRRRESDRSLDRQGCSCSGRRHEEQKPQSKERHQHSSCNYHRREEHSKKSEKHENRRQEGKRKHNDMKEQVHKKPRVQVTCADSDSESSCSRSSCSHSLCSISSRSSCSCSRSCSPFPDKE